MRKNTLLPTIARLMAAASILAVAGVTVMAAPSKPLARSGEILIKVPAGMSAASVDQLVARAGCEMIRPVAFSPDTYLVGLKGRNVKAEPEEPTADMLTAIREFRTAGGAANPNYLRYLTDVKRTRVAAPPGTPIVPNDPLINRQWHMQQIRMPEAWNIQFSNRTVVVGVIDSGVDKSHPDFMDSTGVSRIIDSQKFNTGGVPGVDAVGHGTHVAGTVAAATNNGVGVTGVAGWIRNGVNVQIVDAGVSDTPGIALADIVAAINYCVTKRVDVINMSLGSSADADIERIAVAAAIQAGIVVVAAAGNSSADHTTAPHYPADYPGVIKVTSVGPDKKLTWYSDFGGAENLQIIAAPGGALNGNPADDVMSTWPVNGALLDPSARTYHAIAGTSMASPHVAGAAALLVAAGVAPAQVYKALSDGAQAPGETLDARRHGPGVLDVYSALLPYSDPDPSVRLTAPTAGGASSGVDRGVIYFHQFPITVQLMGVSKVVGSGAVSPAVNESDVTVEVQTLGSQPATVARFVGGRNGSGDFDIPTLGVDDVKAKLFTVQVPRSTTTPPTFGPGQYRIVTKLKGLETSVQFITIQDQVLPAGRSMVAFPFRAGLITSTTPERGLLGLAPTFSLARYNSNRLPGEEDYARYRSNNSLVDGRARFVIPGAPLTFETIDPTVSISPIGNGYWIDLDRATTVNTTLLPTPDLGSVSPIATSAVGIRLFGANGGWNMIGAPYLYPVDWGGASVIADGVNYTLTEAVNAGILAPALVGYRAGDYDYKVAPQGRLEPFRGYWVRAYRDCTLVIPPSASGVNRAVATRAAAVDGWSVRFIAMAAGDRDGQNYIGLSRGAGDGADKQDIAKPPAGAGHIYARFISPGGESSASRTLAYDIRSLATANRKQDWLLAVSTDRENADVTLAWEGIRNAARNGRLVITDVQTGIRIPLDGRPSYTYRSGEAGSTRNFKITLEPQASRGALALNNLRIASRAAGGWSVRFTSSQEAEVSARVVTLTGRPIGVLSGPTRTEAMTETTLRWDGRSADGASVPAGPYRIEILARTADQQTASVQRVIQVIR